MVNANWPAMTFEVCFNVDPFDPSPPAAVWTNLTSRVVAWQHQTPSGRQYELARTEAATIGVLLDNQDGALDASNAASTYWPNVLPYRQFRIKGTWSATTYNLVYGYVERWPQRWDQHKAWVDLIVVDVLALLEAKTFRSCYDEEILADGPIAYYPLSEPAGAQTFGSIATTQQPNAPVVKSKYGGAATVTAGETAIVPQDAAACVSFAGANGPAKQGVVIQLAAAGSGPYTVNQAGTGWCVELWFQASAAVTDPGKLWTQVAANVGTGLLNNGAVRLNTNGTLQVGPVDSGGTTPTSPRYDDGKPHHVVFGFAADAVSWKLYVDGALVISGTNAAGFASNSPYPGWALIGGILTSGAAQEFLGTGATVLVSHVAIYAKLLSAGQALAHYTAGQSAFAGELSGARFSRLLRYAGYQGPSAVDAGQSQMAAAALDGLGATAALQDVAVAENGNLLVAGDGTVTFKQRSARYNTTAVATLGELETPYLGDLVVDFDPTFLYERVEVTRPGGVTVAAFDLAGQKRYGPRTLTETPQILLDLEATDRSNYQLSQYKDPKVRLPQVTLDPASNPALWPVVLGTKIGDRLTVKRRPFGAPVITMDVFVEAISHDVDFRVSQPHWRTTYLLSPASSTKFWLAGDATYSIAGVTTVPGY
jgi:Concanavalin A-like lectin/glucanases superfamily